MVRALVDMCPFVVSTFKRRPCMEDECGHVEPEPDLPKFARLSPRKIDDQRRKIHKYYRYTDGTYIVEPDGDGMEWG